MNNYIKYNNILFPKSIGNKILQNFISRKKNIYILDLHYNYKNILIIYLYTYYITKLYKQKLNIIFNTNIIKNNNILSMNTNWNILKNKILIYYWLISIYNNLSYNINIKKHLLKIIILYKKNLKYNIYLYKVNKSIINFTNYKLQLNNYCNNYNNKSIKNLDTIIKNLLYFST